MFLWKNNIVWQFWHRDVSKVKNSLGADLFSLQSAGHSSSPIALKTFQSPEMEAQHSPHLCFDLETVGCRFFGCLLEFTNWTRIKEKVRPKTHPIFLSVLRFAEQWDLGCEKLLTLIAWIPEWLQQVTVHHTQMVQCSRWDVPDQSEIWLPALVTPATEPLTCEIIRRVFTDRLRDRAIKTQLLSKRVKCSFLLHLWGLLAR